MKKILAVVFSIIIIVVGVYSASNIDVDFSTELFGLSDEEELHRYNELQNKFSKGDAVLIFGFKSKTEINSLKEFQLFDAFSSELRKTEIFKDVHFLTTIDYPRKNGPFVTKSKFIPIDDKLTFEDKFDHIWDYPDITGKFISRDKKSVCIYGFLKSDKLHEIQITQLNSLVGKFEGYESYVIGHAYNGQLIKKTLKDDVIKMSITCFVLIVLFFGALFGSLRTMIFLAWELLFCVASFYSIIYIVGCTLNLLTVSIPIIVITLSLSDTVHIISVTNGFGNLLKKARFDTIKVPLLLTTITTIAGFLVFSITANAILIEFALLASTGLVISYLIARFWSPTLFFLLPDESTSNSIPWNKISNIILDFSLHHSKKIILLSVVICSCTFWLVANRINIDTFMTDRLNYNIEPGRSIQFYQANFTSPRQIELFIEGDDLLNEKTIRSIELIETYLHSNYGANSSESINSSLKRLTRFMRNGAPQQYILPNQINQYYLDKLIEFRGNIGLNSVLSYDLKTLRLVFNTPDFGTNLTLKKNKELSMFLRKTLPKNQKFYVGGPTTINDRSTKNIALLLSVGIVGSIIMVILFIWIYYRSISIAIFGGIVNLIPLLFVLLFYSITIKNIGPSELMILSILLGVAIDDSIHLLSRYRLSQNLTVAYSEIAQPIISTSLLLMAGFSSLLISVIPDNQQNGWALMTGIFVALLCDLILLPALLKLKINSSFASNL